MAKSAARRTLLDVLGISRPWQDVLRTSAVALVFAAVSGWGLLVPFCQPEKLQIQLLLLFQWFLEAAQPLERKVAAVGSSVLLLAPDNIQDISFIQWEYLNGSSSQFIAQYYKNAEAPTVFGSFRDRVLFHPLNGSLLLQKLQEADSGIYKASVNLIESEAKRIILKVLRPVSQSHLWSNSNEAGSQIKLFCNVSEGTVEKIDWEKERAPLPQERCYLLSENRRVLHIEKGEKSTCGSYFCNASNEISWKEASLNLTIVGIPPPLGHALEMSAVALVFSLVSGLGFVLLCCQSEKRRIKGETWRYLMVFIYMLVCLSSALLFAATLLWMLEKGPSVAFILLEVLLVYIVMVTALISATFACQPEKLSRLKSKPWQRVTLDSVAPGAVILVVLFASLLLQKISRLQERGCSPSVDLTGSAVTSAVISLLGLLALFMWYHWTRGNQEENKQRSKEKVQPDTEDMEQL